MQNWPLTITVTGQKVAVVEEFVCLVSLIHSTTEALLICHIAMPSLMQLYKT